MEETKDINPQGSSGKNERDQWLEAFCAIWEERFNNLENLLTKLQAENNG